MLTLISLCITLGVGAPSRWRLKGEEESKHVFTAGRACLHGAHGFLYGSYERKGAILAVKEARGQTNKKRVLCTIDGAWCCAKNCTTAWHGSGAACQPAARAVERDQCIAYVALHGQQLGPTWAMPPPLTCLKIKAGELGMHTVAALAGIAHALGEWMVGEGWVRPPLHPL